MITNHEKKLLASYLANIAAGLDCRDPEARELIDWINNERDNRRVALGAYGNRWRRRHRGAALEDEEVSSETLRRVQKTLRQECSEIQVGQDLTGQRLQQLGETVGLSRADLKILELLLRCSTHTVFESMIDSIFVAPGPRTSVLNVNGWALALILGTKATAIQARLRDGAPLVRSGLVSIDDDGDLGIPHRLHRLAAMPENGNVDTTHLLLDVAPPTDLHYSDFNHIAADRDHVQRLLAGALGSGKPGVNVLLYGPPGTGKTEFCKVLAAKLNATLYRIGEADDNGEEPSRRERLQELGLAQRLVAGNSGSLLLFDEMEDLLDNPLGGLGMFRARHSSRSRGAASRVFMHRLLEQGPTPTLWTMNDADQVSEAILRRMMFALELRLPTSAVRARVWTRQLDHNGIAATPEEAAALASEFEAAPGVAAGATAAASLAGGDVAAVRMGVRSLARLLACDRPAQRAPAGFDPALVQADTDPAALADRLVAGNQRRFSLCLQGPPGTGKSAYVRYLAERLGLEVMQKRTSDLMSMWVGETEKAIARTFANARDVGAFLVFDEADSLLADRRFAQRNWEVSQVNEMLTWMESHLLPFACTTNFGDHLDPATLRRFVFKITLDYLKPEQASAAFRSYFDLPAPPSLAALANLTPGDFSVVRRRAEILGATKDPETLADMLRAECAAKPDRPQAVGFKPQRSCRTVSA